MAELNNFPQVKAKPAFGYEMTESKTGTFTGGKPFINDEFEFPVDKSGRPLNFFCQIDLSKVDERVQKHLSLPGVGYLQFYHEDEDLYGMDLESDDFRDNQSRIIYLAEAFDKDFDFPYREEIGGPEDRSPLEDAGVERVYYEGKYVDLLPFPNSLDNPAITEDDEYGESYFDYYEFVNEATYELYLGGYPHFTQWDFRGQSIHKDKVLLLGSESGSNIIWGDLGAGGFWVPEEDLRNQDYSRSIIFWDCY